MNKKKLKFTTYCKFVLRPNLDAKKYEKCAKNMLHWKQKFQNKFIAKIKDFSNTSLPYVHHIGPITGTSVCLIFTFSSAHFMMSWQSCIPKIHGAQQFLLGPLVLQSIDTLGTSFPPMDFGMAYFRILVVYNYLFLLIYRHLLVA